MSVFALKENPGHVSSRRSLWTKEMRLRRPEDFRAVWSEGRSWAHSLFVVWANAGPLGHGHTRIGITASRKVGNAVARNRARRLLREAARHVYSELVDGWDIVLVARASLLRVNADLVENELRGVLGRAGLLASEDEAPHAAGRDE